MISGAKTYRNRNYASTKRQHENSEEGPRKKRPVVGSSLQTDSETRQIKTEFHCAAAGEGKWVRKLLEIESDTRAVEEGFLEMARQLVAGRAYKCRQDSSGTRSLLQASFSLCKVDASFLANVFSFCNSNAQDANMCMLLHDAAKKGNERLAKLLLLSGARPDIKNNELYPLQEALRIKRKKDGVEKHILAAYALKGIEIDWAEMKFRVNKIRRCIIILTGCNAELERMRNKLLPDSTMSYEDVVKYDVRKLIQELSPETIQQVLYNELIMQCLRVKFPIYFELIKFKLGWAGRLVMERSSKCICLLAKKSLLPHIYCEDVISYFTDQNMRQFLSAFKC